MNKTDEDQILSKVTEVMSKKGKWKTGRRGEFIVASCAYIVARLNSRPITILDIADKLQANPFDLGRVYSSVLSILGISLPDIDPALFLQFCLSSIHIFANLESTTSLSSSTENSNAEFKKQVSNLALRLINIAKNDWILTGRKPTAITAASIVIAFNTLSSSASRNSQLSKDDMKNLCSSLSVSQGTVNSRIKEMKQLLVDMGKRFLPWGNDIDLKNITFHIPSLLSYMEMLEKSPKENESPSSTQIQLSEGNKNEDKTEITRVIPTLPPSMYKRQAIKQRRLDKLIHAKQRISIALSSNSPPNPTVSTIALLPLISESNHFRSRKRIKREEDNDGFLSPTKRRNSLPNKEVDLYTNLDEEDIEIEKSLLQGIPENIILETDSTFFSANKCTSLLAEQSPKVIGRNLDSEDLTEQDIPDHEIFNFIKSSEEVEKEQQLFNLQV